MKPTRIKESMNTDVLGVLRRIESMLSINGKEMMTTEEAGEYIGCSPRTMRELATNRDIPHYKDPKGRIIRFRRADLDAWMQYLRVDSQQEMDDAVARRMIGYKNGRYENDRKNAVSR